MKKLSSENVAHDAAWRDGFQYLASAPRAVRSRLVPLLALMLSAGAIFAHHGNSAYDETARVTIKGAVTEFIWTNPHSQIYLDVKDKAGKIVKWGVETNSPGILTRAGWTRRSLKPGDEVSIILCPAKNGQPVAYAGSGDPGTKVIFADGRVLDFVDKTVDKTIEKAGP